MTSHGRHDWKPRGDAKRIRDLDGVQFCWASGLTKAISGWGGPWFLHAAHLGSGSGSFRRVDDARAVILLSPLAHMLHSVKPRSITVLGKRYPSLTNANVIWLKQRFDPANYDPEFIEHYWTGVPPIPEPPAEWYSQQMLDNQGVRL